MPIFMQRARRPRACALGTSARHGRLPETRALLSQGNLDYSADWMEINFEY